MASDVLVLSIRTGLIACIGIVDKVVSSAVLCFTGLAVDVIWTVASIAAGGTGQAREVS